MTQGYTGFGAPSARDLEAPAVEGVPEADDATGAVRKRPGRMRVLLTVHGGTNALMNVMEGLVQRDMRALQQRRVPLVEQAAASGVRYDPAPIWRDNVSALIDGVASAGTLAVWRAAEERLRGRPAAVALIGGVPQVIDTMSGALIADPSLIAGRHPASISGIVGATSNPDVGRVTEYMYLALDDDEALPVRDVGDAIARHNATRIRVKGLPPLYGSGVRYKTEGTPEKWWDAEEILAHGFDDCEGLSAYRAGELMDQGYDAHVWTRLIQRPSTFMGGSGVGRLFHAIVRVNTPKGPVYDDPSMRLGMRIPDWYRQYAAQRRAQGKEL